VKTPQHRHFASLIAVATLTFAAGCHKKAVPPPPPPPPAATSPAPTASITVTPDSINPGGSAVLAWNSTDATARLTVTAAAAPPQNTGEMMNEQIFEQNVKPAFFDYDSYEIRPDAQTVLAQDASFLAAHPTLKVVIGGYCDDRGSAEYNLALGENRANAAKQSLVNGGVSPDRVRTVSYGKEKQFCTQADEACWQQNRRAGFSLDQ